MEPGQEDAAAAGAAAGGQQLAPPAVQRANKVYLNDFWRENPHAWFAAADLKFEVAGVESERAKFANAIGAMPFSVLRHVMDLVERPPAVDPYTTLRGRLVLAHELSPVEKADKMLALAPSPDCRPSETLAQMMEFCPTGEETTSLFRAAFIRRLAPSLQIHLIHHQASEMKELTQMADRLWLCHGPQMTANVETEKEEDEEEDTVASIPKRFSKTKKPVSKPPQEAIKKQDGQEWADKLCFHHKRYGAKAYSCKDPKKCSWSGN